LARVTILIQIKIGEIVKGELYHDINRKTGDKKTTKQIAGIERSKDRTKKTPENDDIFPGFIFSTSTIAWSVIL